MEYRLSFERPSEQLISVSIHAKGGEKGAKEIYRLPKWRPGRYELQRFDKLIADLEAVSDSGKKLAVKALSTHSWEIETGEEDYTIRYVFYANQRDSGGSAFDKDGIYVNPCNLLLYRKESIDDPCTLTLNLPEGYTLACGLPRNGNTLFANDFHEMADSPFFASDKLQSMDFHVNNLHVYLWFMGECKPDFGRFQRDITEYTEAQIAVFGDCPVSEYHYLCLILPYTFRHGVEHQTSSVNTMGPGFNLMQEDKYQSFIELLSHEFFHTWNVKYLRPADMYPYDYDRENYSELHYITEGITSYYGDLMLYKSGIYTLERFLKNLNSELYEHHLMPGKEYISLEKASFNSWINGYGAESGIPNRKISFYTKGYIVAFMLDYEIRSGSENVFSMDEVLREMYQAIGRKHKGYTKEDFKTLCEKFAGKPLDDFFEKYIEGVVSLEEGLKKAGKYFGFTLRKTHAALPSENIWGLKLAGNQIAGVHPDSPAAKSGLTKGDEIVAVNGYKASPNEDLWRYFSGEENIRVHYFHFEQLKSAVLQNSRSMDASIPVFIQSAFPSEDVESNIEKWVTITPFEANPATN
ncbi:MAG: PDZ domain-containing protein [Bacteroidia bacterium]|nr:PDZ domain-containing protein [Bacteroidia bacterium]